MDLWLNPRLDLLFNLYSSFFIHMNTHCLLLYGIAEMGMREEKMLAFSFCPSNL